MNPAVDKHTTVTRPPVPKARGHRLRLFAMLVGDGTAVRHVILYKYLYNKLFAEHPKNVSTADRRYVDRVVQWLSMSVVSAEKLELIGHIITQDRGHSTQGSAVYNIR